MSTAQTLGRRVESEDARTPSSSTYANPDGSWTTESYAGVVRSRDDAEKWVPIDAAVARDGKRFRAKAAPFDASFSAGSDRSLATLATPTKAKVRVGWPTVLPTPRVNGATLTYPDVMPGTDVRVTSRPDGFNYSLVLDHAPAAGSGPVVFRIPLSFEGARTQARADGSIAVLHGKQQVAALTAPVMWDNSTAADPGRQAEPTKRPVAATVEGNGSSRVLVLRPDMGFLTSPTTRYPLVVDPSVVLNAAGDTWVQSSGTTTSQETSPELRTGSNDGGVTAARSYVYFDFSTLSGVPLSSISSAQVKLSNFVTGACTGSALRMSRVVGGWTLPGITWANQPTVATGTATTTTGSFGAAGCDTEGTVVFNAMPILSEWLAGYPNLGLQIRADDETGAGGFRRFRSVENGDPTRVPTFTISWNGTPNVPTDTTIDPGNTGGGTVYTSSTTPTFSAAVTDPDSSLITAQLQILSGSTVVQDWTSGQVASGTRVSRTPTTALAQGTYTARWRASDGTFTSAWSPSQTFVVDTTAPATPVVSCTSYANNGWYTTRPAASTTCTVTVTADAFMLYATNNGQELAFPPISAGKSSLALPVATNDLVSLDVSARDKAGNWSTTHYAFGVGGGLASSPTPGARSPGVFPVNASGKSGATSAVVQWQLSGASAWTTATGVTKSGAGWSGTVTAASLASVTGDLEWNAAAQSGITVPSNLNVRVCFNYSTAPTQLCTSAVPVSLVQHPFGSYFPTAQVGPASVSLMTGEFQVDSADITVPGYADALSLSRTYQSVGAPATAAQSVFGPGWVANLDGPSEGFAAAQVLDRTGVDGTISLIDTDGEASVYKLGGASAQAPGVYVAQGLAGTFNERLEITNTTPRKLVLTEEDGTVTTWSYAGSNAWTVSAITDPTTPAGSPGTTYEYASGYVTGIFSAPAGVTCNGTTQARGCRALLLTYSGTGTATRLTEADVRIWDPKPSTTTNPGEPTAAAAMVTVPVARYAYDTAGKLTSAWDPRLDYGTGSHVATGYAYQTVNSKTYLASITPPGQQPWQFNLDTTGRLDTVTRPQDPAVGGTAATWRVKYGVALSGTTLPTMTAAAVGAWGQPAPPTRAGAVFGPDAPGTTDFTYADLYYFTADGRTVNTASYGAGAWQIESTGYNPAGQEIWSLDAANKALGASYGWSGREINRDLGSRTIYSPSGDRVEEEWGPNANVVTKSGVTVYGRKRVRYLYDDEAAAALVPGRPTPVAGQPRANLPVEVTTDVPEVHDIDVFDPEVTRYRYDPVVAGDGNGWTLKTPTRVSEQLGSGWSTTLTRYDTQGRVIETRTPQGVATLDGAGSDARSTVTAYYTADASSPDIACQSRPEWADQVCHTGPAGPSSATTAPTTVTAGLDYLFNPTRSVEAYSGGTSRITVTAYDQAGRKTSDSTSFFGTPTGQQPVPDTTYTYDQATGALTATTAAGNSATTTYDTWGRAVSQTDGIPGGGASTGGNTATTTYDTAGRVKTLDDGKGTYTYGYDGTDALGKTEHRGLVTSLDVGLPTGPDVFTAAYDNAGNQAKLVYPNGVSAESTYDGLGNLITLLYKAPGATAAFLGYIQYSDIDGRTRTTLAGNTAETYTYDDRGRLTTVQDRYGTQCDTRTYGFSLDSDRTSLTSYNPAADGSCSTTSGSTVTTGTFDIDDRKTDPGYVYDNLARTTTLPAADTTDPVNGPLTIAYYADDMVASLSRPSATAGAQSKTYGLDPLERLATLSSTTNSVELRKTTNHYADGGDAPAWVTEDTRPNATTAWTSTWTRNVEAPGGDLGLIQKSDGTSRIQLANPHGDIVATLPNTTAFSGLQNYNEPTEYGLVRANATPLNQYYTWLGAKSRSTDALAGLTLMGVRLYNPFTGRFLSRDPVVGGNDNAYTYPVDPVNRLDLDGRINRTPGEGAGGSPGVGFTFPRPPRAIRRGAKRATAIVSKFGRLSYSHRGIRPYRVQRKFTSGNKGCIQAHHLIEKRFRRRMGGNTNDWPSIVLTQEEHLEFTLAWRREIPYGRGTSGATRKQILQAARKIYREYPEILRALGLD